MFPNEELMLVMWCQYGSWLIAVCRVLHCALASRHSQCLLCITQPHMIPHQDTDTSLHLFLGRGGYVSPAP